MERIYRQYFTINDDGSYNLLIVDHSNQRYCITKMAKMPAGKLVDENEFSQVLGRLNNTIHYWYSFIASNAYTEVDDLEAVTKLQEYVLGEAVLSRKISAWKIMEKYGVNAERANSMMNWMERMGFISPEINGVHRVLMSQDDYIVNFRT